MFIRYPSTLLVLLIPRARDFRGDEGEEKASIHLLRCVDGGTTARRKRQYRIMVTESERERGRERAAGERENAKY